MLVPMKNGATSARASVPGVAMGRDVAVEIAAPDAVELKGPSSDAPVLVGDTMTLSATVFSSGKPIDFPGVRWESGDPAIATIDSTGHLTAKKLGITTITATAGAVSKQFELRVSTPGGLVVDTPDVACAGILKLRTGAFYLILSPQVAGGCLGLSRS